MLEKQQKRLRRHKRIRAKIKGTAKIPRLCVFKSGKHIYAQLIDDEKNKIITAAKGQEINKFDSAADAAKIKKSAIQKEEKDKTRKVAKAFEVGKLIAKKALDKKIEKVVFDRGGYKYHGRIKSLAEGAREGGLQFKYYDKRKKVSMIQEKNKFDSAASPAKINKFDSAADAAKIKKENNPAVKDKESAEKRTFGQRGGFRPVNTFSQSDRAPEFESKLLDLARVTEWRPAAGVSGFGLS